MFNAMTPLRHREPGTAGAVLVSNVPAMLICDGEHVHPAAVETLMRAKTTEQVILVTDGIGAAGMPDGVFKLLGARSPCATGGQRCPTARWPAARSPSIEPS